MPKPNLRRIQWETKAALTAVAKVVATRVEAPLVVPTTAAAQAAAAGSGSPRHGRIQPKLDPPSF